ncbi:Dipeptidyl peptidase iii [Lasiodiplodia theobromae]|uniref:Dipeptidyl peptidase iii n=1 Tax=Lasiodiplodia theobromae TaxID=45133 RepID=UPI0015C3DDE6|nr:Dipeptidyl peptidase iii [Lasiodiplodia theobromae]KAF4546387.1 Dipeptidyl peptidase iii [Lasiodiplodia theobromae]
MSAKELLADTDPPILLLYAHHAFRQLDDREKLYAHYMSQAAHHGARIIMNQVSPESEAIFDLIAALANFCGGDWESLAVSAGLGEAALKPFLEYASTFLDSVGNYRGYGDTKILPRIATRDFEQLCSVSERTQELFCQLKDAIYGPIPSRLGFPSDNAMSAFYPDSPSITENEIKTVQEALLGQGMSLQNTRLKKLSGTNGGAVFEVLVASVNKTSPEGTTTVLSLPDRVGTIHLVYGDYSVHLKKVCDSLELAKQHATDGLQREYLEHSILSFQTGSIESHKEASIRWVQNSSPTVETIIGFTESYRDPIGVRCTWETLVGLQDKSQSEAFDRAASRAMRYILRLPWTGETGGASQGQPGGFENSEFHRPDFVGLEIFTWSSANMWTGVSGPQYRDVKQRYGKKHFTMTNRANAVNPLAKFPFVKSNEVSEYVRLRMISFNTILAIHELFGHGCGKYLSEVEDSVFNFDSKFPPTNPLTGKQVSTWYKPGQNPKSVFGGIYPSYNECFAESVGLYLMSEEDLLIDLGIIGPHTDVKTADLIYNAYLLIVNMGIEGLLTFDPESNKWNQAHARVKA